LSRELPAHPRSGGREEPGAAHAEAARRGGGGERGDDQRDRDGEGAAAAGDDREAGAGVGGGAGGAFGAPLGATSPVCLLIFGVRNGFVEPVAVRAVSPRGLPRCGPI